MRMVESLDPVKRWNEWNTHLLVTKLGNLSYFIGRIAIGLNITNLILITKKNRRSNVL